MSYLIACLCGQVSQDIRLEPSADPAVFNVCHCNACRATTGVLCFSYYALAAPPATLDNLREYPQSDRISRYFCRTCGSHVFGHRKDTGQYWVASGVFAETSPPAQTVRHWRASDTQDGGLSPYLPGEAGNPASGCFLLDSPGPSEQTLTPSPEDNGKQTSDLDGPQVSARCHCGGVKYYVTPPDATSFEATSPWADLLVPYFSSTGENPDDVKWFLCDENTRYLAGTCACPSCRIGCGFPIQEWAFIPKANLFNVDRSPLAFNTGTMQRYNSSPGVYREFCSRCGANIFWHCDFRPLLIDVSVGLLQAKSGARAEELLHWHHDRVSFKEMGQDQGLVERLEEGLKASAKS